MTLGRPTDALLMLMLLPNEGDALLLRWMLMCFARLLLIPVRKMRYSRIPPPLAQLRSLVRAVAADPVL